MERKDNLRDYLASERTLLAWIRTGLSLMGFGFVIARFGLALESVPGIPFGTLARPYGASFWLGSVLILAGIVVIGGGLGSYRSQVRQLESPPSPWAMGLAGFLIAAGIAISIYLFSFRQVGTVDPRERLESTMQPTDNGIVSIPTHHSVDQTVDRIQDLLLQKQIELFAVIDHSGEALKAGLSMPSTKLVIFGNPKAGTPLMVAAPTVAIDLPLKLLVSEDTQGQVWVSYNRPEYLQARHGLPSNLISNIAVIEGLAKQVAGD